MSVATRASGPSCRRVGDGHPANGIVRERGDLRSSGLAPAGLAHQGEIGRAPRAAASRRRRARPSPVQLEPSTTQVVGAASRSSTAGSERDLVGPPQGHRGGLHIRSGATSRQVAAGIATGLDEYQSSRGRTQRASTRASSQLGPSDGRPGSPSARGGGWSRPRPSPRRRSGTSPRRGDGDEVEDTRRAAMRRSPSPPATWAIGETAQSGELGLHLGDAVPATTSGRIGSPKAPAPGARVGARPLPAAALRSAATAVLQSASAPAGPQVPAA